MEFLRENGQTEEIMKTLFKQGPILNFSDSKSKDDPTTKASVSKSGGKGSSEKKDLEPVSWETLKARVITVPSGDYPNPYENRADHGWKKSGTGFITEVREISLFLYLRTI
jgi:hypothetical protein